MAKSFRQIMNEYQVNEKLKLKKGKKNASSNIKKAVKDFEKSDAPQFKGKSKKKRAEMGVAAGLSKANESINEGLDMSDLGFTSEMSKGIKTKLNEHIATIGYTVSIDPKKEREEYDLDFSDIGLVLESDDLEKDAEEMSRDNQNSVDTMEEKPEGETDNTPKVAAASMGNAPEEKDEKPLPGVKEPKYKTISLTVPALQHVLKVVAFKSPDKVTINSMIHSMQAFCDEGCTIDVKDLEEIKHKMHGMEYNGGESEEGVTSEPDEVSNDGQVDPSIYSTPDVVDDTDAESTDDSPVGGEEESGEDSEGEGDVPVAATKDAADASGDGEKASDGKTQLDDEGEEEEEKASEEEPSEEEPSEEKPEEPEGDEKSEKSPKDDKKDDEEKKDEEDEVEESLDFADTIEAVYEGITDKDIRDIRRRSNLTYWDK